MREATAWKIGITLIVIFTLASELTIAFYEYFYARLSLNRNIILSILWALPAIASFLVALYSRKHAFIGVLILFIILTVLGPTIHLVAGILGAKIDLAGLNGVKATAQIYMTMSALVIGVGALIGFSFRLARPGSKRH